MGIRYKRVHTIWLHSQEAQEQANSLITVEGRILCTGSRGMVSAGNELEELSGMTEMWLHRYTQNVKTHWAPHLRFMHSMLIIP